MVALSQELFATSNNFVYDNHSNPVDSQTRFFNTNLLPQMKEHVRQTQETEAEEEGDYPAATLKYISQMLMEEEDLENQPYMLRDCMALQATEKYFSDALNASAAADIIPPLPPDGFSWTSALTNSSDETPFDLTPPISVVTNGSPEEKRAGDHSPSKGKRNHNSSSSSPSSSSCDGAEMPRNKQLASYSDESEAAFQMFDNLFPCSKKDPKSEPSQQSEQSKVGGGGRRGSRGNKKKKQEFVDFRSLLTQCANHMANQEIRTARETLQKIRQHATPQGNGMERAAFYIADALEARLNGTGTSLYASHLPNNTSAADVLKAYQMYITACPFKTASTMMANKYIRKLVAGDEARLHIIDFGILYGFQWACLIQGLSARPGGPPRLRVTGIDFPQPGFRPAERVNATGLRLEKYCRKFNVPFEFNGIAKKWESVELEELRLDRDDDVLVVNCLDRMGNVPDETVVANSPRDIVLGLIKQINPDVFVHGIVNGAYNATYFPTRFRETLFHFSGLFDVFEQTVPREDNDRRLFEEMVLGREVLNVIACEGTERVERPETYKQWQVRSLRAGFRPLPLDQEIVKCVKEKVKSDYNKNFSMDEDGNWLLQGWKGKLLHAVSYWKPCN